MDKTYSQKNSVYCIFEDSIAQAAYAKTGWMDKLDFSDFQDGLHPNEQGHRKIFEVIKNYF